MTQAPVRRKRCVGKVVSDRMTRTVVVEVTRRVRHPIYPRVVRRVKRFKVHDPGQNAHTGDEVRIERTRPLSKEKRWRLVEVVRRGPPPDSDPRLRGEGPAPSVEVAG